MKYVRCDNAGENEDFEWACKQEEMSVQFECTALDTLQISCCIE